MSQLILTPEHEYYIGGRRLRGVTSVLDECGYISDFAKSNPRRTEEGLVAHACCALLAQGKLDWSEVDHAVLGYVLSYAKLLEHTAWVVTAVETRLADERLGYAGTFDLCTELRLADLKTGPAQKYHAMQLGAYWHLAGERHKCAGIYLQADGSIAKIKEYNGREGYKDFLVCLNFLNTKERYANGSTRN